MKLWTFLRQNVKLVLKDGSIISGFVQEYCNKDDNDEDIDSIGLDVDGTLYEYFEDEILSISVAQRLERVKGLRMSKQLWSYLRSRVQVVTSDGKTIKGLVTDFIDEMDNDEQDEITILIDVPRHDEPTEISLLESEIVSIKVISQRLEQSRRFTCLVWNENTMEKVLDLYGNIR